jgi:hypothetical protein
MAAALIGLGCDVADASTCRVEVEPSSCQVREGLTMKGGGKFTTPQGITYRMNGMTVSDYNRGLCQPQMRTFLGPEYFNSGCSSLYCRDKQTCPNSKMASGCNQTGDMMSYLFESQADFIGNDAPPPCFGGSKCGGYGSVVGWETNPNGPGLKWQAGGTQMACGQQMFQ